MVPDALTGGPRSAAFCEHDVRHTKGRWAREPLRLEDWQRDFWNEALEVDPVTGLRLGGGPACQVEVLRAYIVGEATARQPLSGLYRRTGCVSAAQAAYLLGRADASVPRTNWPVTGTRCGASSGP